MSPNSTASLLVFGTVIFSMPIGILTIKVFLSDSVGLDMEMSKRDVQKGTYKNGLNVQTHLFNG